MIFIRFLQLIVKKFKLPNFLVFLINGTSIVIVLFYTGNPMKTIFCSQLCWKNLLLFCVYVNVFAMQKPIAIQVILYKNNKMFRILWSITVETMFGVSLSKK